MTEYAAILLSRQPLRPTRKTTWVEFTVAAVQWLADCGLGVVSSVGLQTWELIVVAARDRGVPIKLVVPSKDSHDFDRCCRSIRHEYDLDPSGTDFVAVLGDRSDRSARRDDLVCQSADLLLPVSVRDNGTMSERIVREVALGRACDDRFRTPYRSRGESIKINLDTNQLSEAITNFGASHLIHWTRAVSHPWPGERTIDFYRAILGSDTWPRSGLATLERIVRTQTIRASSRHMPGRVKTVSFSGHKPNEVVPLMRWRARYREMSFEPYGIGVAREVAARFGVAAVDYYPSGDRQTIPADSLWCSQTIGKFTDWRDENEYRCRGDLSLEGVPTEAITLFCMTVAEADRLRRRFPYRVVSFQK